MIDAAIAQLQQQLAGSGGRPGAKPYKLGMGGVGGGGVGGGAPMMNFGPRTAPNRPEVISQGGQQGIQGAGGNFQPLGASALRRLNAGRTPGQFQGPNGIAGASRRPVAMNGGGLQPGRGPGAGPDGNPWGGGGINYMDLITRAASSRPGGMPTSMLPNQGPGPTVDPAQQPVNVMTKPLPAQGVGGVPAGGPGDAPSTSGLSGGPGGLAVLQGNPGAGIGNPTELLQPNAQPPAIPNFGPGAGGAGGRPAFLPMADARGGAGGGYAGLLGRFAF